MSIRKIFRNFKLYIIIGLITLAAITYSFFNISLDIQKSALVKQIQSQSRDILKFPTRDLQASQSMVKQHMHYMHVALSDIQALGNQDLIGVYLLKNHAFDAAFNTLSARIEILIQKATLYFAQPDETLKAEIEIIQQTIPSLALSVLYANIEQIREKNAFFIYLTAAALTLITFMILWYFRRLSQIYKDFQTMLSIDENNRAKDYLTEEFIAIKRRGERRPTASGGKSLLDPLTELFNEKGLFAEFAHRTATSSKEYICVTTFDIDDYKDLEIRYGKAFCDTVVKKIAFMLSLEKKPTEIVARIGEDKFAIIMGREDSHSAYKEVNILRETISKTEFKPNKNEKITISVSGGFAIKDRHEKLESTLASSNNLLRRAKLQGKNQLVRLHDFDEEKNSRM